MTMPPPTPVPSVSIDEVRRAAPGPEPPLGERGGARVVLDADRKPEALARRAATRSTSSSGRFVARRIRPVPRSRFAGNAVADRDDALVEQLLDGRVERRRATSASDPSGVSISCVATHVPVPIDETREDLRPSHVEPDDEGSSHGAGYL